MEELIKIRVTDKGNQAVSGRDLHSYLAVRTDFTDWMKRMIEYGFDERSDFFKVEETNSGIKRSDYVMRLDMAKEICMIQRSEKGKVARKYFIACETKLKEVVSTSAHEIPKSFAEALMLAANQAQQIEEQQARIEVMAPKSRAADILLLSEDGVTIGALAKTIGMGQNRMFKALREDKFLIPDGARMNLPYQKYIDHGLFKVREVTRSADNKIKLFMQTLVTAKGQVYLSNLYSKQNGKQEI